MKIPDWYVLGLLSLASFRTWHLLAEDDILDRPRRYVTAGREGWEDFISCPFCLGFWVTLAWWGAWEIWPFGVEVASVPMALSALVPMLYRVSSQE